MAFLQIIVPLCLLFVNIFSVFLQVGWICGFIWADITFSGCFWLCHSIGVLSHVIVDFPTEASPHFSHVKDRLS